MEICPRIYRRHCNLFKIRKRPYRPRPQHINAFPQRRYNTQTKKGVSFFTKTNDYLGHAIRPRILDIASHNASSISELQPPTNITELRSVLVLRNIFQRFVSNFARTAMSLNAKLRKDKPKTFRPFSGDKLKSIFLPKDSLISSPVQALPKFHRIYHPGHICM